VATTATRRFRHRAEQLLAFDALLPGCRDGGIPLGHVGKRFLIGGAAGNGVEFDDVWLLLCSEGMIPLRMVVAAIPGAVRKRRDGHHPANRNHKSHRTALIAAAL
jgi:hypothetical protein